MTVNVLEYDTIETRTPRPAQVIGPLGEPLTLEFAAAAFDHPLGRPPQGRGRRRGQRRAAHRRRGLRSATRSASRSSPSWQRAVDRSGMPGLRVTRIQHYKSLYERQQKF